MFPDGKLLTTLEHKDFLERYNLEHDSASGFFLSSPALARMTSTLGFSVAYCPRQLINPVDLKYFNPRSHALADANLARIAHMAQTEPLWLATSCASVSKAIVRLTARRTLRSEIRKALEADGYDKYGKSTTPGKEDLWGTISIHITNPVKIVTASLDTFGPAVLALIKSNQRRTRQPPNRQYHPTRSVHQSREKGRTFRPDG